MIMVETYFHVQYIQCKIHVHNISYDIGKKKCMSHKLIQYQLRLLVRLGSGLV